MIDFTKLPAADAERIAYAEGFTGTAALFARIAELENAAHALLGGDLDADIVKVMDQLREVLP